MRITKIWILLGFLFALAGLTGCAGEESASSVDLAIVSGYHANAPVPAIDSATALEALRASTASYGSVCLIINDGAPFVAADYDIAAPQKKLSNTKMEEIAQSQVNQLVSVLSSTQAITPETDTLAAISLAARSLADADGEKYILMLDSGLSTSGYVDFTKNLLNADPAAVVDYLTQNKALPDLENINVIWAGLGDVAGIQKTLTPSALESLRTIWAEVLRAAGVKSTNFAVDLPSAEEKKGLPYVTPVEITQDAPMVIEPLPISFDEPFVLDEEKVLFLPDSDIFADPAAAAAALQPIVEHLNVHPGLELMLAGTTAQVGNNESSIQLSRMRAEAVKALLVDLGAEESRIAKTIGLGFDHPYHLQDIGPDGLLNDNAPYNRSVILFDADSQAASELLARY